MKLANGFARVFAVQTHEERQTYAMTLRLRLMLVTSAVVLFLFGISEWLSYRHTAALLEWHEAILVETADHAVALERNSAIPETECS